MITLTLIRHGESEDNITTNYAGWKDAPLTALGERQADALGTAFNASSTRFQHFYSSDLRRAHSTALAVMKHHTSPKPPLKLSQKLREQNFGIAEGRAWIPSPGSKPIEEWHAEGVFPQLHGRDAKFPEGESLNDVARRAEDALRECILPHVFDKAQDVLRLDPGVEGTKSYQGHRNTAWSRIKISVREGYEGKYDLNSPPPLQIQLVTFNSCEHLDTVPPAAPVNEEARAFFSGAGTSA